MKDRDNNNTINLVNTEEMMTDSGGPMYFRPGYPAYYAAAYGGDAGGGAEEGVDLLKLLRVLMRRWVTVVLFIVVGVLGAMLYCHLATPIYKAEAELEMSVRRPKVINSQAVYEDATSSRDTDAIINTRFAKFRSPTMEKMALAELQRRFSDEKITSGELHNALKYDVEWSKDRNSNIIRVSAKSADPQFAVRLARVLTYCAGELMVQENQAQSEGAVQWLNAQADEQHVKLDKVERELTELRKSVQIDSLNQRATALGEALNEVSASKSTVENELETRKATYVFLQELAAEGQEFEKLPSGLPKEGQFLQLVAAYRTAKSDLAQVADRYTQAHPEYQRLAKEVVRTRGRVEEFVADLAVSVQNRIRLLERQQAQLDERVQSLEAQSVALEQKVVSGEQQLQILQRRRDAADEAYQSVLRRMEEARLSADENTAFINIVREATLLDGRVSPRTLLVIAFGVFLGLLAGGGLALLTEYWADKIMLVGDLKDLRLNILGTVPTQKQVTARGDLATLGLKDKFSHVFEIFAGINTLVSSDKYRDRTKVLLLCSVMPGEGKTMAACNLAISAALNGARTLLIDGDLRRPRLANVFEISDTHPSLLEWLSAEDQTLDFAHLVSKGVHRNLDIITSRPHRHTNPAELLGRGRLAELIAWARKNYDRVVIDSPPLGLVGDTQALANESDSLIIVSRLGVTKKRALKFALNRLDELDAFVLGCIANDVPHSISGMFGGGGEYGYAYSGYGDYKSYGRAEVETNA